MILGFYIDYLGRGGCLGLICGIRYLDYVVYNFNRDSRNNLREII